MSQKVNDIARALKALSSSNEQLKNSVRDCKRSADQFLKESTPIRPNDISLEEKQAYLKAYFDINESFKKPRDEVPSSSEKENGDEKRNLGSISQYRKFRH